MTMKNILTMLAAVLLTSGLVMATTYPLPVDGDAWTESSTYSSGWSYIEGAEDPCAPNVAYVTDSNSVVGSTYVSTKSMWQTYSFAYFAFPGGPIDLSDTTVIPDFWFMVYMLEPYSSTNMDLEIRLFTDSNAPLGSYKSLVYNPSTGGIVGGNVDNPNWVHFEYPVSSYHNSDGTPNLSHVYGIGFLGYGGGRHSFGIDGLHFRPLQVDDQGYGQTKLSHGHEVLLKKGLIVDAIAPAYYWGSLNQDNWRSSNFNSIQGLWAINDAGTGDNYGYWTDQVASNVTDYRLEPNLTNVQFYDEQPITEPCLPQLTIDVAHLKTLYPNSIVYLNNQIAASYYTASQITLNQLKSYTQTVKPDMLHFTEYPFRWQGIAGAAQNYVGGSPTSFYMQMELYRQAALAGLDGIGTTPIPTGMYVQQYRTTEYGSIPNGTSTQWYNTRFPSESEMNLQTFAGWAFGFKKETSYFYANWGSAVNRENEAIAFSDVAGDNTPTPAFYQIASMNKESRNLGDALVRLLSTDVRMKMGRHFGGVTNTLPSGFGVSIGDFSSMPAGYITGGWVNNNPSGINGGYEGDVVLGFFRSIYEDPTTACNPNETYFMVVNGLSDADANSAACTQTITLMFDFGTSGIGRLLRLNRETGAVETVENGWTYFGAGYGSGGVFRLDLTLGGGKGDLFRYNTGSFIPEQPATIVAQSPAAGSDGIFRNSTGVSSVDLLWSKPVRFGVGDISIVNEHGGLIAKTVSGTGSASMHISFTTPLLNDKYTVTISGVSSEATGLAVDGDKDGYIGGDAVVVLEHRNTCDLNKDNKVDFKDFSFLASEWLNQN
jgi:hypothetical protein